MSRCKSTEWSAQLLWLLLGLRTTPKEIDNISPAESVYGETLHVPAYFFPNTTTPDIEATRMAMNHFQPVPQNYKDDRTRFMPPDLRHCRHVFLRINATKPPLTPPYSGPYLIKDQREKTLRLQVGNKLEWVSIDHVKQAYLLGNDVPPVEFSRVRHPLTRTRPPLGGSIVEANLPHLTA